MLYEISYFFLMFFIYSILGYIVEVTSVSIIQKKLVLSRGYLIGPYLPIFGFGAMIVTFYLTQYENDVVALFIMSTVFCCLLEYLTSLVLEKLFKLRWWDYSEEKFNINGRVCLKTGVMFGLGGVLIIKVFNQIIIKIFNLFSKNTIIIFAILIAIIIISDFIISTFAIIRLKIDTTKYTNKDATKAIKEEVEKSLRKYRYFHNRLIKAFPNMTKKENNMLTIKDIINNKKK